MKGELYFIVLFAFLPSEANGCLFCLIRQVPLGVLKGTINIIFKLQEWTLLFQEKNKETNTQK